MSWRRTWFAEGLGVDERELLDALVHGSVPAHAKLVHERILRRVWRVPLADGGAVYAKQHEFPFRRVRLRYALRAAPTQHERRLLSVALQRGVLVPEPLAEATTRGCLGPTRAVLVTRELVGESHLGVAQRLAAAAQLADSGIFHPDLHTDNVLRVGERFGYLDFQSARLQAGPVRGRRLVVMLAKTAHGGLGQVPRASLLVEIERVLVPTSGVSARVVLDAVERLDARGVASRRRHRLRSSSAVVRERSGFGVRLRLRGFELPSDFAPERSLCHPRLGACHVARSVDGRVFRLRCRCSLRRLWGDERTDSGGAKPAILAWHRAWPWPWREETLYFSISTGGLDIDAAVDLLLGRGGASPDAPLSVPESPPEE